MNIDDYMYVYFSIIGKAAELYPTSDQKVVYELSVSDNKFYSIVRKVGEDGMIQQLRQLFTELTRNGIFRGTVAKQEVVISAVTPLGYSVLEQAKNESSWNTIKKSAPKWVNNSLTNFLIVYLVQ